MELGNLSRALIDLFRQGQGRLKGLRPEEIFLPDGLALDEQAGLFRCVPLQGVQGGANGGGLALYRQERGGLSGEKRGPFRIGQGLLRLQHLHAASVLQAGQQFFPLGRQGEQPQPLHFDY